MGIGRLLFLAGIVVAAIAAFVDIPFLPWVVGGLGIVTGFLNVKGTEKKTFLLAGTGLVVALSAILQQHFNPDWLNDVVFFERVFVAHVLLAVAFLCVFRTAGD